MSNFKKRSCHLAKDYHSMTANTNISILNLTNANILCVFSTFFSYWLLKLCTLTYCSNETYLEFVGFQTKFILDYVPTYAVLFMYM